MNLQLLLARHGQTAWNDEGRCQGHINIPLNETGERQVAALAKRLANEDIGTIYASDLQRAWQTALAISTYHNCPLIAEPRLREMSFGEWQGLTSEEILQRNPQAFTDRAADPLDYAPPGGESLRQLVERVRSVLADIQNRHTEGRVLIVTHAGPIKALLCLTFELAPQAYWRFKVNAASLSIMSLYPEGAILELFNDTCHLNDLPH